MSLKQQPDAVVLACLAAVSSVSFAEWHGHLALSAESRHVSPGNGCLVSAPIERRTLKI
jgi:hypothetical protein